MSSNPKPRLTIGMACYDDFNGVYFTIQAIQLYHAEVLDQIEFVVVDNHPDSVEGQTTHAFLSSWVKQARYIPTQGVVGTSAPRDLVFREARGEAVLCLDCHVLLAPGVLKKLIDYYEQHPDCRDLLQGPILYDDCQKVYSHMDPVWRQAMFGTWGLDPRGQDPAGESFEIPLHGCGLMSCRKDAWLGFNPEFRGFGGEEGYLQEKYRQAGARVLCLPFLRWLHRFGRPQGVPYPLHLRDRVRNYIIGRQELGQGYEDVLDHFADFLTGADLDHVLSDMGLPTLFEHWFHGKGSKAKVAA